MVADFTPRFSVAPSLPPQNVDAEESLLGAILLDPGAIGRVANRLHPEAFYIDAHGLIYKAALAIFGDNQLVDLMSVMTWLTDRRYLEKVGGQCRLFELVDKTVSSVNIDRWAELIIDKFIRRQLIQAANSTIQAAYETFRKLPELFTEAKERLTALMNTPSLSGEDPDQFAYNKLCLEIQQIELNISDPGLRLWKLQKLAQQYGRSAKQLEAIYFMSLLKEENESLLTWKELSDRYGDLVREWILHGFLPKGVTVAVHARGGVGKTRLAYDMLYSLLQGTSWNEFPSTGKRRAIVIQTDESAGDMLDALRRRGFDEKLDNVRYKTRWTFEHIPQLKAEIEEFKPEVIVIDSITSVNKHSLFSENDVQYARPILKLKDLAQQYGCTIILVHHSSKAGEARGTSAIFNSVSEVWKLEKDPEDKTPSSTKRLLTIEKSRSRRPTTYRLDFEPEQASWKVIGEVGINENNPDLSTKERIVAFLLEHLNVRYEASEIAHEINGSEARVRLCCAQLAGDGIISHIRPAGKGKGKAHLYFIADDHLLESDRSTDRSTDRFSEAKKAIEEGDQLISYESTRVSADSNFSDRPFAKNTTAEEKERDNFSDRAIRKIESCPEPSDIKGNKAIALPDRSTDRLSDRPESDRLSDQKPSWTKAVFAAVNSESDARAATERVNHEIKKGQWGRLVGVDRDMDNKLVHATGDLDRNGNLMVSEHKSPEFSHPGVPLIAVVKGEQFKPLSKEERLRLGLSQVKYPSHSHLPYHPRTNPPKKGDRICNMNGKRGEIIEAKTRKYEIRWEDGRKEVYSFKDLEILDVRRED